MNFLSFLSFGLPNILIIIAMFAIKLKGKMNRKGVLFFCYPWISAIFYILTLVNVFTMKWYEAGIQAAWLIVFFAIVGIGKSGDQTSGIIKFFIAISALFSVSFTIALI